MKQRGIVREYTKDTEKRLTARLKAFVRSIAGGRAMWVTLTTTEDDPEIAKEIFRRWTGRVRRRFDVHGVYVLEFNERKLCHYHVVLALKGEFARKPATVIKHELWQLWKNLGRHDANAFKVHPANLKDPSWLIRYMTKGDDEQGEPHPKRWQKALPERFKTRGARAHFWGVIGRKEPPQTAFNPPLDEAVDVVPFPLVSQEAA